MVNRCAYCESRAMPRHIILNDKNDSEKQKLCTQECLRSWIMHQAVYQQLTRYVSAKCSYCGDHIGDDGIAFKSCQYDSTILPALFCCEECMLEYIILCSSIAEAKKLPVTARELANIISEGYYDKKVFGILDNLENRCEEYPFYISHDYELILKKTLESDAVEIAKLSIELYYRIHNSNA